MRLNPPAPTRAGLHAFPAETASQGRFYPAAPAPDENFPGLGIDSVATHHPQTKGKIAQRQSLNAMHGEFGKKESDIQKNGVTVHIT